MIGGLFRYFFNPLEFMDLFTCYGGGGKGGGGGGPQQVTSTTTSSNIPEYARPYVENMLGSAQKQIYNDDMTSFRPYQPYSSNVNDYVAGFSPLQQSAQQGAYNMQVPGQFGAGSQLAGMSGIGSLGVAGQAAGAGQQYANQAQDPNALRGYMSPYMQNVVDYQKGQAFRDYQMGQPIMQAQAVGQGAFGGNRLALQQSEAQRGLMSQLQGIEAQGSQSAFQNAQQQQQFGANLGLQGYGTALQGLGQAGQAASTLGGLGAQQQAAEQGIINTQSTMGSQQQALEQQKINQSIQDYATQQQYPFMQLGMLNSLLRGLPMQSMSTQQYQSAPSGLTQGLGAVGTLAGAYKAFGAKEGGQIHGYKAGGEIKTYQAGGDVVNSVRAQLETMQPAQLQQVMQTSSSEEVRKMAAEVLMEKKMAEQAQAQVPAMPAQPAPQQSQGIAAAPTPSLETMADGGIIAFAGGDQVEDEDMQYVDLAQKMRERAGVTGAPNEKYKEFMANQVGGLEGMKQREKGMMLMDYFSNFGTQPGSLVQAGLKAAKETSPGIRASYDKMKKAETEIAKGQADLDQADRLEKLGLSKEASALRKDQLDRDKAIEVANINSRASAASANRATDLDKTTTAIYNDLVAKGAPKNEATAAVARQQAIQMTGLGQSKLDMATNAKILDAENKSETLKSLNREMVMADDKDKPNIQIKIDAEKRRIASTISGQASEAPATPAPSTGGNLPVSVPGPNGETLYLQPNGKYSAVKPKG